MNKERNFGLDVVRALSIILVLIAHSLHPSVELGILGVQVFFVLSGFLIGQILIRSYRADQKRASLFSFWKRRWFRTLPMYYLVLIGKILTTGNPYGWKVLVYFVFLQEHKQNSVFRKILNS